MPTTGNAPAVSRSAVQNRWGTSGVQGGKARAGGSSGQHDWAQQLNSRDKIIAELRARNQALKGAAAPRPRSSPRQPWPCQAQQPASVYPSLPVVLDPIGCRFISSHSSYH